MRGGGDCEPLPWLDLRRAVELPPEPLDFVLPGLAAGTVGALVSPGGAGKTMLALQAAVTVAGGADLLGLAGLDVTWQCDQGRVVFLTGEDPDNVLSARLHSIGRQLALTELESVIENLSVATLLGRGADLMSAAWRRRMSDATHDTRLVVIDTLRRFHHLDENNGTDMAGLVSFMEQLCRENKTTVLFLHHTSKAAALNGGEAQQASRGSSVLTDNCRFQANLVCMAREQASQLGISENYRNFVRLSFSKINYSAQPSDQWFRRCTDGLLKPIELSSKMSGSARGRRREQV